MYIHIYIYIHLYIHMYIYIYIVFFGLLISFRLLYLLGLCALFDRPNVAAAWLLGGLTQHHVGVLGKVGSQRRFPGFRYIGKPCKERTRRISKAASDRSCKRCVQAALAFSYALSCWQSNLCLRTHSLTTTRHWSHSAVDCRRNPQSKPTIASRPPIHKKGFVQKAVGNVVRHAYHGQQEARTHQQLWR